MMASIIVGLILIIIILLLIKEGAKLEEERSVIPAINDKPIVKYEESGPEESESEEEVKEEAKTEIKFIRTVRIGAGCPEVKESFDKIFDFPSFRKLFLDKLKDADKSAVYNKVEEKKVLLEKKLDEFGISGKVVDTFVGPVITRYEFEPGPGVRISKVGALADDLGFFLKSSNIKITPIPEKGVISIEVPNEIKETVYIKELLTDEFSKMDLKLPIALGKDVTGEPVYIDLTSLPHLLIAGTTGSGKSACIHSIITSLLFNKTHREVRFFLIDSKFLELTLYKRVPHLMPFFGRRLIATNINAAYDALLCAIDWMETRYIMFSRVGARDIVEYNEMVKDNPKPYILVIIDEIADLMLEAPREIEVSLIKLAQMGRAAGIHLIVATQRPSADVLTGLIKANFPARIACQTASATDSRIILGESGAERLLGEGDMLFLAPGKDTPIRLKGAYVSTEEIKQIVDLWTRLWLWAILFDIEKREILIKEIMERNFIDLFDPNTRMDYPDYKNRVKAFYKEMSEKFGIEELMSPNIIEGAYHLMPPDADDYCKLREEGVFKRK